MTNFPVTDSTLSARHLAIFMQDKYGFNDRVTCKIFRTGINHTYMVVNNEIKYVLRIYCINWRSKLEISEEIRLLNLLKENQISVSYPILDKNENYIQTLEAPEGTRYAVLFSFAEGRKIRNLTHKTCFSIGMLMARMHKVTINQKIERINYDINTLTEVPYANATSLFSESMEEMQFLKKSCTHLKTLFSEVPGNMRNGIVHLDLWYDNMNIVDDSSITLFDFDFCGNGWLMLDITYFIMQLFNTEPDRGLYKTKLQSFMNGYQSITPIPDEEKRLLPIAGIAIWIFYLGVQSSRFDNWSNIFLSENYLKHYVGIIKNWMNFYDIEINKGGPIK